MTIQTTVLKVADSVAEVFGILNRPLVADQLIEAARSRTGLREFGEPELYEALQHFLDPCVLESSLSLVGRIATRWDVLRFLCNLLRMRQEESENPGILGQPVRRPIFITGLPRSGTTFLHRLLMEDGANRAPLVWQTIYPYPERGRDRRLARVARQLRAFEALAPEFRALHPLNADSPQECSDITAHVFRSLRFDTNYNIPSYREWLDADPAEHVPAYRFHRRFLQHLQYQQAGGQWVVKCPDHLFALPAIRAVYPDARLIFVHRDPVKVLLSVAKLTEVLRAPFTRRLDRMEIGRQESARWLEGTRRMMLCDEAGLEHPVCHVHHLDLIHDPLGTVQRVYRHFALDLDANAESAMRRFTHAKPNGGYGRHVYRFEDHGLDGEAEREKFRSYMLHFGVASEPTPAPRDTGPRAPTMRPAVAGG